MHSRNLTYPHLLGEEEGTLPSGGYLDLAPPLKALLCYPAEQEGESPTPGLPPDNERKFSGLAYYTPPHPPTPPTPPRTLVSIIGLTLLDHEGAFCLRLSVETRASPH